MSHALYLLAVPGALADQVDYAMLVKIYGAEPQLRSDTALPSVSVRKRSQSRATRTRSITARPTLSAATSRCGCTCAASLG
jgi:hypothetical protein